MIHAQYVESTEDLKFVACVNKQFVTIDSDQNALNYTSNNTIAMINQLVNFLILFFK